MKKMNRVLKILVIAMVLILTSFANQAFASQEINNSSISSEPVAEVAKTEMSDIFQAARDFIGIGEKAAEENKETSVDNLALEFSAIGAILFAIGVATLLIVGGIMAIKWITATPDKQAKLKEQLIGYVIAAVVIFGAIGIWNFVRGLGSKVEENLESGSVNQVIVSNVEVEYKA